MNKSDCRDLLGNGTEVGGDPWEGRMNQSEGRKFRSGLALLLFSCSKMEFRDVKRNSKFGSRGKMIIVK